MNENFYSELQRVFDGNGSADNPYKITSEADPRRQRGFDGDGSANNPYKITSEADLRRFVHDVNGGNNFAGKFFLLTADIKLEKRLVPSDGFNDDGDNTFSGTFDGGGHTISGLIIISDVWHALFPYVDENGTIKNLNLTNVNIGGRGTLVGINHGTIENCTVSDAAIIGNYPVGGLVGTNNSGTIENCTVSDAAIIGSNRPVGGLVGLNGGTIANCTVSGATVSGEEEVGGFVGWNSGGTIENCSVSNVKVSGNQKVGGLVGVNLNTIANCTVSGATVSGDGKVGGFVGWNYKNGEISGTNYYQGNQARIVGKNEGTTFGTVQQLQAAK